MATERQITPKQPYTTPSVSNQQDYGMEKAMSAMMMMMVMASVVGQLLPSRTSADAFGSNVNWTWVLTNTQLGQYQVMIPDSGSATGQWNSGVATSTIAGDDLVELGTEGIVSWIHSLVIDISRFSIGSTVTIRLYQTVDGVDTESYAQNFATGVDPNGIWIINGSVAIDGILRVEVRSDQPVDDGVRVGYKHIVGVMVKTEAPAT